jgi:hypothetical protein
MSSVLFLFRIILGLQGLSWFYMNFVITFSSSVKNSRSILIGIELNL